MDSCNSVRGLFEQLQPTPMNYSKVVSKFLVLEDGRFQCLLFVSQTIKIFICCIQLLLVCYSESTADFFCIGSS